MLTAILVIIVIALAFEWFKWKTIAKALKHYMEKNQYKLPNDKEEARECIGFAINNMFKGSKNKK